MKKLLSYAAGTALVALTVALFTKGLHVNATTVALTLLLDVLAVATVWGLAAGIFTSALGVIAFNYFFLPPIGTLTINDPENWVALAAFLLTAITASNLSAQAQKRAEEATARRLETENLYGLGRSMLLSAGWATDIQKRFGLDRAELLDLRDGRSHGTGDPDLETMRRVAETSEAEYSEGLAVLPVRLGGEPKGSLWLQGTLPSRTVCEAIANLVAISWERDQAMENAARADAARRSEKLKGAVLDGLAHDLKTPLTVIKTAVTSLLDQDKSEERRREFLGLINEGADRLAGTISQAIQLARVEAADVRLDRRWYDSGDLAREAIASAGLGDQAERVQLSVEEPAPRLFCDRELLKQALRQLLGNATRYSPEGSPVSLQVRATDGVILSVADQGPGVPEAERDRIFEKFYRGYNMRAETEGTGMGLAVAKEIVEAHGGRIDVSAGPGAVFSCWFPVPKMSVTE